MPDPNLLNLPLATSLPLDQRIYKGCFSDSKSKSSNASNSAFTGAFEELLCSKVFVCNSFVWIGFFIEEIQMAITSLVLSFIKLDLLINNDT